MISAEITIPESHLRGNYPGRFHRYSLPSSRNRDIEWQSATCRLPKRQSARLVTLITQSQAGQENACLEVGVEFALAVLLKDCDSPL